MAIIPRRVDSSPSWALPTRPPHVIYMSYSREVVRYLASALLPEDPCAPVNPSECTTFAEYAARERLRGRALVDRKLRRQGYVRLVAGPLILVLMYLHSHYC